jgi:ABC-type uncharacterized transport system permease subunit
MMKSADSTAGCLARAVGCALAVGVGALGLLFLYAASVRHSGLRVAVGAALVLGAVGIGLLAAQAHLRARDRDPTPGAGLSAIHEARCPACGRSLDDQRVHMEGPAAVIHCPACGGAYRLEEEPEW